MSVINHIGISGGKDSTALLLWAVHESGYPRESLDVTFCDTGNEHPITYDYVRMLSEKVHPIRTLKPERDFYELAKWKKRFPGAKSRFCTIFLKIEPSKKHLQTLLDAGAEVVMHSGVRANESSERAKLVQREEIRAGLTEYRPLLRWTLDDVWAIHKRHGIEPNPLYSLGAKRVGCLPCIMSSKAEVGTSRRAGRNGLTGFGWTRTQALSNRTTGSRASFVQPLSLCDFAPRRSPRKTGE